MAYASEMVAMTVPAAAIATILAIFLRWPSDGKSLPPEDGALRDIYWNGKDYIVAESINCMNVAGAGSAFKRALT